MAILWAPAAKAGVRVCRVEAAKAHARLRWAARLNSAGSLARRLPGHVGAVRRQRSAQGATNGRRAQEFMRSQMPWNETALTAVILPRAMQDVARHAPERLPKRHTHMPCAHDQRKVAKRSRKNLAARQT